MKKLGKLLLCAGILFTTAACSKEDPIDTKALDKLDKVIKQTESYKSGAYTMNIDSDSEGTSLKGNMHGEFLINENPQFSLFMDMEAEDEPEKLSLSLFLFENNLYADLMGSKMKLSSDSAGALYGVEVPKEDTTKDTKSTFKAKSLKIYLKTASLSDNKIVLDFDSKKLNSDMNEDSLPDSLASSLDGVTIKKLALEVKYDKQNYLTGVKFTLDMTKKVDGEKTSGKLIYNIKITDRDKIDKVEMPTDLDTYMDLESAFSGLDDPTLPDDSDDYLTDDELYDGL